MRGCVCAFEFGRVERKRSPNGQRGQVCPRGTNVSCGGGGYGGEIWPVIFTSDTGPSIHVALCIALLLARWSLLASTMCT